MIVAQTTTGRLIIVGANHRSSSLALRDALFVDDEAAPAFLARLRAAGLEQAAVLCTCDRIEVLTVHHDPKAAADKVSTVLAERAGIDAASLGGQLYVHTDGDAVRHCFAVTASLDSLVIGEPHVLGQVKEAHRIAQASGMCGSEMESLLQAAFTTAKRVRSETAIAERPVSIAAAAAQFARDLHGDLSRASALLVGAGDMGELVAEALRNSGLSRLVVTAPRASRAEALAKSLDASCRPFEDLPAALADADIVLSSVGGRGIVLTADLVQAALKKRKRKPIFLVDAGIPGDVDTAVNNLDGAFLYDLADLERIAMEGRASREQAARAAWTIVDEELATFLRSRAARAAVPAIVALRQRFETERLAVLQEAGNDAERATQLLLARLLHDPSEAMKDIAAKGDSGKAEWLATEQMLRHLFRLDDK
ncbi:glutamyl-tRNA reductase [Telmatospirillum sp. J64-1]|uniref:glutamyl-tRNA reductase n=1 Tax=Telmatospirillum sp. J64-1 TaxID=2502183 RepID=UPI002102846D|nr:glutamyl-tRNA reductase [Telmatospirillum sp. J64-1]